MNDLAPIIQLALCVGLFGLGWFVFRYTSHWALGLLMSYVGVFGVALTLWATLQ